MSNDSSNHTGAGSEEKTPASQVSDPGNLRTPMFNHYSIIDKSRVVSLRWFVPAPVFGCYMREHLQMAFPGTDEKGQPTLHWEDVPFVHEGKE